MRPAREDGRPLFFDIMPGAKVKCHTCACAANETEYGYRQGFISDPANPPPGLPQGSVYTLCHGHLPDNAVIFNPHPVPGENTCRNKPGTLIWQEYATIVRPDGRPI